MQICVTGAGGFLGTGVVRALQAAQMTVRGHAGPPGAPGPAEWLRCRIDDVEVVRRWLSPCDVVVHLAGPPWVGRSFADPVGWARAHTVGTAAVIEAAREGGASLVYVSSAEVYEPPTSARPISETASTDPRSPYGAVKLGAEALVRSMASEVPAVILRPFCVYGPQGHSDSVTGRILSQVTRGATRIQIADARPVRDFLFVDDFAAAVRAAIDRVAPDAPILNLASGVGTPIGTLARIALQAADREGSVEEVGPRRPSEPSWRVGDPSRAERELGWTADTPLETGLRTMLRDRWFA